jgi:DNA primase catalytic core
MAYVTRIGPSTTQVEYRLIEASGCATPGTEPTDRQFDYHVEGERPLRWIGGGCTDYGVVEGAAFTEADLDRARALMDGIDWRTGDRLVAAKVEVAPTAKLPGEPLLEAILLEATRRAVEPLELFDSARQRGIYRRLARGVEQRGELYAMHVDLIGSLADAAGVDVLDTYGNAFMEALAHREERIDVRNRGYDLALTLPKSFSVLMAYAPADLARELEREVFDVAAQDTLRYIEKTTSYGMRGHHGDGRNAERIETSGFVGWSLVHRASRAGDPHHHVHLNVANMVRGVDGKWSAVAAGGRDLMRHTHAMGAYLEARARHLLRARYGIEFSRSERSGQWEVVGIPDSTLRLFSKRDTEIRAFLEKMGLAWDDASTGVKRAARDVTRDAKSADVVAAGDDELRARWQAEGRKHGDDPPQVVAAALGRVRVGSDLVDLDQVAEQVFDPESGITANRKSFDRAAAFAVVLEQLDCGLPDLATADAIVDAVLDRSPQAIALPPKGPRHMSDVDRYTTADLVQAERAILQSASRRLDENAAVVPDAVADMALSTYEAGQGRPLSDEQRAAYRRLVTGGHGVDALVGVAGSGKTTIVEAARIAWDAAGCTVTGAATAAVAAQNLQTQTGVRSSTIASLLHGRAALGDVLVVDEAAMVDERSMARIVGMAAQSGTKIVGIGDPKQLRAAGVGGSFAHVHRIVDGPTLTENRRQLDSVDRGCAALVRDGKFAAALGGWAQQGSVHVSDTRDEALASLVLAWAERRGGYADPHARSREVLMIAYTNVDVDTLNTGARALLRDAGQIGADDRVYRLADGAELRLAIGDVLRVRQNLWSRDADKSLLNGHRGILTEIRGDGSLVVDWRPTAAETRRRLVNVADVTRGAISLGYAITDHAAQGQTADAAFVYPVGMDANALYPAVTRHREDLHVFIPLDVVEDELIRRRLGRPRSEHERTVRAVEALARNINVVAEEMVSLELAALTGQERTAAVERHPVAVAAALDPQPLPRRLVEPAQQPAEVTVQREQAQRNRSVIEQAARFYADQPPPTWFGSYLGDRGLRPADLAAHGFASPGWTALVDHLRNLGINDQEMLDAGVAKRSSRGTLIDVMRDRLVLPISDDQGPVAFIGRNSPEADGPKWLNTIYAKGELLYGLADAAPALRAGAVPVLVEGPLDVAAINAAGKGRFVGLAPLGTAVTTHHVKSLAAHVTADQGVIVGFDADDAGTAAALRAYDLLKPWTQNSARLELPAGTDPADLLGRQGPAALREGLEAATPLVEQVIDAAIFRWGERLRWPEGRLGALRAAAPFVANLAPDQAVVQIVRLMHHLDLPHETVTEAVTRALPRVVATKPAPTPDPAPRHNVGIDRGRSARPRRPDPGRQIPRRGPGIGI